MTWVRDEKYATLLFVMLLAICIHISVPENITDIQHSEGAEPSQFYRMIKIALLVFGAGITMWRISFARLVARYLNGFYIAFVGLVALSAIWSITRSATLTKLLAIGELSLVSFGFVLVAWHAKRFQNVLRPILTLMLVASVLFYLVAPDLAKEQGDSLSLKDAWRGIFWTKNTFGEAGSLGTILWLHAWLAKEVRFRNFAFGLALSGACVMLSRSSTAIIATAFGVALLLLLFKGHKGDRFTRYTVIFIALAFVIYATAALNIVPGLDGLLSPITAMTGKDTSFSGRTIIWDLVREHIKLRPWLGNGYGAYWIGPVPTAESYFMLKLLYGLPNEAHNGYLDIINDLGYAGLACFVGYVVVYLRQCFELLKRDRGQSALYLALLFQQLIGNLTESMWWNSTSLNFVVMTLATFALARTAADEHLRTAYAPEPVLDQPRQSRSEGRLQRPVRAGTRRFT